MEFREYNTDSEDLFISYMVTDPELYARTKCILKAKYFDDPTNKKVLEFFDEYTEKYSVLPTLEEIKAVTQKSIKKIEDLSERNKKFYFDEIEVFCRHKALELAILDSLEDLKKKNYGEVERKVKEAVQIALIKDLGTDYFLSPVARLERMRDHSNMISTGWKSIDKVLFGGVSRGTLNLVAGSSGTGKSVILQNIARNWTLMGLNVVYLTLELSEDLCSLRLDAMFSGYGTKDVMKNMEDVALKLGTIQKKHKGTLQIKMLPSGCTANDIRAYVKEYEIQTGVKVDAIVLDYLDLCMPVRKGVSASDLFVKDKYVSEELRNLAIDLDILFFSASQFNRSAAEEVDFGHHHISGGISKINTADNLLGIFVTPAMKENGRYQLQFLKTRSSAGTGHKVDLAYNPTTMVLSDLEDDDERIMSNAAQVNKLVASLKTSSTIKTGPNNSIPVDVQDKIGAKLTPNGGISNSSEEKPHSEEDEVKSKSMSLMERMRRHKQ